jgi:probable HAF family extracellular repeat protein
MLRHLLRITLIILATADVSSAASYQIVDLGTFGGDESIASDINNLGQVVGNAKLANGTRHAFLFAGGPLQDLGTLGGAFSSAAAINDNGQIAGTAWNATNENRAFRYSGGPLQDLGSLAGGPGNHRVPSTTGAAINSLGHVVGWSQVDDLTTHAFFYSNGPIQDLGPGGSPVTAVAINAAGQIAGNGFSDAWLYDGTFHPLGSFGGHNTKAMGSMRPARLSVTHTTLTIPRTVASSTAAGRLYHCQPSVDSAARLGTSTTSAKSSVVHTSREVAPSTTAFCTAAV